MEDSKKAGKIFLPKIILQALFVRLILVCHALTAVWRLTVLRENYEYWLILGLINVLHIPETIYTIVKRRGMEAKWICVCFVIYLGSVVPATWMLELDRLDQYILKKEEYENSTESLTDADQIAGVSIPIKLDNDTWVSLIEQSLLFILIVGRWFLPRGELTRDQLSQLLFVFIGMGSDIMELFVLFEEPEIREHRNVTLAILVIWSVSLVQFCLVLTATRNIKRGRVTAVRPMNQPETDEKGTNACSCLETEIWSLLVSLIMQDGPFLCVRLYVLLYLEVMTYSIFFFIAKNSLLVALLMYRLSVLVCDVNHKHKEKEMSTPSKF